VEDQQYEEDNKEMVREPAGDEQPQQSSRATTRSTGTMQHAANTA
jgi:hypothetical protein